MSFYLVTGKQRYRDHDPGVTFEAALNPAAEARAIKRGDIHLIQTSTPAILPGTYTAPTKQQGGV